MRPCFAIAHVDQVHLRGAYQVWQENETFAAAGGRALGRDVRRASGVSAGARAIGAGGARPLHRTEAETEAVIGTRKILFEVPALSARALDERVRRHPRAVNPPFEKVIADFMAISPRELRSLAERSPINADDQIATLSSVLGIASRPRFCPAATARSRPSSSRTSAYSLRQARRLFSVSSEIAEDLEGLEEVMRARAQHLRQRADGL